MQSKSTILNYYWVEPQKLLAGQYPLAIDRDELRLKLCHLINLGITVYIDLTEDGEKELYAYTKELKEEAVAQGLKVEYHRIPIVDFGIPSVETMKKILATIDGALSDGKITYIHCFAGIGRTGTVVGCHLSRIGLSGKEAVEAIDRLQQGTHFEGSTSILTIEQRTMIRNWKSAK